MNTRQDFVSLPDADLLDLAIEFLRSEYSYNVVLAYQYFQKKINLELATAVQKKAEQMLPIIKAYNLRHSIGCNICGTEWGIDENRAICRECLRARNETD